MKDHHITKTQCLTCGKEHDGALGVDSNDKPKPGDVSICINCCALHIFNDDFSFRAPTEQDILELPLDEISKAQRILREAKNANSI